MMFKKGANITILPSMGTHIIKTAEQFLGLHETAQNAAWDNPETAGLDEAATELKKLMVKTGWQEGWAYCAAFVEAVWCDSYVEQKAPRWLITELAQKFTPSVVRTFRNFEDQITDNPEPGAVFFMQLGNTWRGHCGIVTRVVGPKILTIEGNTSPEPDDADADREGDGIFRRVRTMDFTEKQGLWLRGFLNPVLTT